jgi:hypothetical protein
MQKEKIKFRPANLKKTYGTSRIGTVHATYDELVEVLGIPHDRTIEGEWESRDNKTRVEWAFVINNDKKLIFTIYDYKSRYPLEQIKQWSLGGKSSDVKDYLKDKLMVE